MEHFLCLYILFLFDLHYQIKLVQASKCRPHIVCPDQQCCHGGKRCCDSNLYHLWWFWFGVVVALFLILICIIALQRRRQNRREYTRFDFPAYGGAVAQPRRPLYHQNDPPPPYLSTMALDQKPPSYQ
ncbi:WW domain binding protein 1-like [Saccostrea echinata]|uniref:WW domain binding protein 1-like n=1 Tax=Saccostrea echinata TaxID=191078 RepID=UPI002A83CC52|nr:WW domain binding protein 1-like [Saccostrea echinata]